MCNTFINKGKKVGVPYEGGGIGGGTLNFPGHHSPRPASHPAPLTTEGATPEGSRATERGETEAQGATCPGWSWRAGTPGAPHRAPTHPCSSLHLLGPGSPAAPAPGRGPRRSQLAVSSRSSSWKERSRLPANPILAEFSLKHKSSQVRPASSAGAGGRRGADTRAPPGPRAHTRAVPGRARSLLRDSRHGQIGARRPRRPETLRWMECQL